MDIPSIGSSYLSVPGVLGRPMAIGSTPADQRRAVADQFEAILLRQFLNQSVGQMMGGSNSTEGGVYGYLLTDVLSQKMASAGGMGLAKIIEQQLSPGGARPESAERAASAYVVAGKGAA